jgi:subtilase family serine protease
VGTLSVPAALGADVATVTGLDQTVPPGGNSPAARAARQPARRQQIAPRTAPAASGTATYQCSQYWGQHTEKIPAAYGRTTAPTQLCGYTPAQIRKAYGITGSRYTGKGATVAIILAEAWPTMLSDANRFFASHLADVVSNSWDTPVSTYSPADVAAWNLVFEQGALEGIGFDYASGDGGSFGPDGGLPTSAMFPSADPWVTGVGGTSLAIGKNGTAVADYPWGDNVTQVNGSGTGYTPPLPGTYQAGSGGGLTALFAQPGYQASVVPAALATDGGKAPARRVVPDISANAGSNILIGYTGAVTNGVYAEVICGGTSASTPLIAGLEADAMQAAGHPLGFANPVLYRLYRTVAIRDVPAVNAQHPPILFGQSIYTDGNNNLTTVGEDQPPLQSTAGYDDVTGLGAATASFVTAFPKRS